MATVTAFGWNSSGGLQMDPQGFGTTEQLDSIYFSTNDSSSVSATTLVRLGDGGAVTITNHSAGTVHTRVFLQGWFKAAPAPSGSCPSGSAPSENGICIPNYVPIPNDPDAAVDDPNAVDKSSGQVAAKVASANQGANELRQIGFDSDLGYTTARVAETSSQFSDASTVDTADNSTGVATVCPPNCSKPAKYKLPEIVNLAIYKEGEGNSKKYWTCGPSVTRTMVSGMHKRLYGTYQDLGEALFEKLEGTTRDGTSARNVAAALNLPRFHKYGSWSIYRPGDKYDFVSTVAANTYGFGQSIPMSVDTEFLAYWNNHHAGHFILLYGYNRDASPWRVYVADPWDPQFLFGHSMSYGNPYGRHSVRNLEAYNALMTTSYHYMVR